MARTFIAELTAALEAAALAGVYIRREYERFTPIPDARGPIRTAGGSGDLSGSNGRVAGSNVGAAGDLASDRSRHVRDLRPALCGRQPGTATSAGNLNNPCTLCQGRIV